MISRSPVLYHSSSLYSSLGFWLLVLHHSNCLLLHFAPRVVLTASGISKQTEVGVLKSIIARSEATCLLVSLSLSLPLSQPFLLLCLFSLRSASESGDDHACLFLQGRKHHTMLQNLTLSHTMLARYLPLQISLSVSENQYG